MKHDPSDTGHPHNPYAGLLDMEEMDPEGTTLELYWYLKGQVGRGVPGAKAEVERFREMAEAEIRANAELAIKALHFPDQDSLLRWVQSDQDAYRMAMADTTYREMLRRSWSCGGHK